MEAKRGYQGSKFGKMMSFPTCVWIGLKLRRLVYRDSNSARRKAEMGSGCKSSSSVGGGFFSGSSRCRKDTGSTASQESHLSDTT